MKLQNFYDELSRFDLQHHEVTEYTNAGITIHATTDDTDLLDEIMAIKELADKHETYMIWDGETIKITRLHPPAS